MKKTRMEKGITLIALIITIVVLLILAVVTIGAVQESDIMSKGKYAADEYNKAKESEESVLLGYQSFIESNLPGGQSSDDVTGDNNGGDGSVQLPIGPNGGLDNPGNDPIQGEGIDGVILNSTATSIPNGIYYYLGESTEEQRLIIADNSNIINAYDGNHPATVTINNGEVTVSFVVDEEERVFEGKYYETINGNKIITLGTGEFKSNGRIGYIFAINTNDLKYDIDGVFTGQSTSRVTFTEGEKNVVQTFSGSAVRNYIYAGFEDKFYINNYQVNYIGLDTGFKWDDNGTHKRES